MKKSRFTEVQVVQALQKHEFGVSTGVLCREMGIAPATFLIGNPSASCVP